MIVEINQAQVNEIIARLEGFGKKITTGAILEQLALQIKNIIYLRTQSGKDADGRPFAPYSVPYAKREGKTLVNLTKTGHLLNAMTQKVLTNSTAKVFFTTYTYPNGMTTQTLAEIHNEKGAGKKGVVRKFFGVNEMDLQDLTKTYESEVARIKEELKL